MSREDASQDIGRTVEYVVYKMDAITPPERMFYEIGGVIARPDLFVMSTFDRDKADETAKGNEDLVVQQVFYNEAGTAIATRNYCFENGTEISSTASSPVGGIL